MTIPLHLGPVVLDSPLVQAALAGYSDLPMRVLARRHGASYALGEVLLDRFVTEVGTNRRNLARLSSERRLRG